MFEGSLLELLFKGGISMIPLVFCSLIITAVIIEKLWYIKKISIDEEALLLRIEEILKRSLPTEAVNLCNMYPLSLIANVFKAGLLKIDKTQDEIKQVVLRACSDSEQKLYKFIWILGTTGAVAPFIGLFGTVIGIIRAFRSIAITGRGGIDVVASGIAEALIATASGLVVAIIAVVAYNLFLVKINHILHRIKLSAEKFIELLAEIKKIK